MVSWSCCDNFKAVVTFAELATISAEKKRGNCQIFTFNRKLFHWYNLYMFPLSFLLSFVFLLFLLCYWCFFVQYVFFFFSNCCDMIWRFNDPTWIKFSAFVHESLLTLVRFGESSMEFFVLDAETLQIPVTHQLLKNFLWREWMNRKCV